MYQLGFLFHRKNLQKPLCYPKMVCPTGCRYPMTYQAKIVYPPFKPTCQCDRYLRYV